MVQHPAIENPGWISLVSRPPCPTAQRQSGTVAWPKRQASFPLKYM